MKYMMNIIVFTLELNMKVSISMEEQRNSSVKVWF